MRNKETSISDCLACVLLITGLTLSACYPNAISSTSGLGIKGGSLGVTIWASRNCVPLDTPVHLRATVVNHSSMSQVFQAKDKPVFDLEVTYDGKTYRWSEGKPLTPDLTRLDLNPLGSKTIEMDWKADHRATDFSASVGAVLIYGDLPDQRVNPGLLVSIETCPGY